MHKTTVLLQVRKMQKSLNSAFRQVLQEPFQKGQFTTENAPKTRFVTLGIFWFHFGVAVMPIFVQRIWTRNP